MSDEIFIKQLRENLSKRAICEIEPPRGSFRAAVAAIIRNGTDGAELCFIKRSFHPLDRFSGHIAFPGGMKEDGDADMLATAFRETREEIGVNLETCCAVAGRLDDEIPRSSGKSERSYLATPFVCVLKTDVSASAGSEVEEVFWAAARELKRGGENPPEFSYKGRRIWGMTARIVEKLLAVLP